MASTFEAVRPALVFHLAAQVDVRFSVEQPARDAETNVLGTIPCSRRRERRSAADRKQLDRRRPVRRGGCATDPRGPSGPLACPLRPGQLAAEGYCDLRAPARAVDRVAPIRQCVRAPPGRTRGGRVVAIFCGCLVEQRAPTVFGDGRRRAIGSSVADVVRRICWRPIRVRRARSTSGRGGRPRCWSCSRR